MGGAARKISPPAHNSTENEQISRTASAIHSLRVLLMAISSANARMVVRTLRTSP